MQALERPRFRHDHLIAELVEADDGRFVDVMDPDSGNMFRFYEVEYSIACGMDGERDVAGLVKWAQDELGLSPSATEVQAVIATLTGLQFVDTTAADGKIAKAAPTAPSDARGDELAAGVVVGKSAPAPIVPAADVELGHSGARSAASARAAEELPKADFDLGAPGSVAAAKASAASPVEDIGLGAPGARSEAGKAKQPQSEVSIDLSEHLSIKPDDVKEAVRASKVMSAVEMPKDLIEEENAAKAAAEKAAAQKAAADKAAAEKAAAEKAAAEKAAAEKAAAQKAAEKAAADAKAAAEASAAATKKAAAEKKTEKKPAEPSKQPEKKTEKKAEERAKSVAPPAPSSGPSAALVIILILAVVGAGAFFVWKYVINKPDETAPSPSSKVVPPPVTAPPPAPDITAALTIEAPSPAELKAGAAGEIESIEPADKDVKAGDTIAWLAGAKALQAEVAKLTADVEKLQPAVTKAEEALSAEQQKENNERGVKSAQKKLDAAKKPLEVKQSALTQKQGELDKLAVKATIDGKLAEPVAVGAKVDAGGVIAKVVQPAAPVVSFKVPAGVKLSNDGSVQVAGAGAPVACKVVDAQAETIKVACPADPSLTAGATVKLVLPN